MSAVSPYKDLELKLHIGPWGRDIKHTIKTTRMRMIGTLKYIDSKGLPEFLIVIQLEHRTSCNLEKGYECRTMIGQIMGKDDEAAMFTQLSDIWCSHCWFKDPVGEHGGVVIPPYLRNRYFGLIGSLPPCIGCGSFFAAFEDNLGTDYKTIFRVYHEPILYKAVEQALAPYGGLVVERSLHFTQRMRKRLKDQIVARAMCPERVGGIVEKFGLEGLEASF